MDINALYNEWLEKADADPDLKVELENIMIDFTNHKFDILLCTTIIEDFIVLLNSVRQDSEE